MKISGSIGKSLVLLVCISVVGTAIAQKRGGVLKRANDENPPSASLHENGSNIVTTPFVPVFNNLVDFDHSKDRSVPEHIVPDLATSWSWSADSMVLTFKLRRGVKWHDGKPFSANDVKCTWDTLSGKRDGGWRRNPRKAWFANLKEIVVDAEDQVSFHLKRPQPSFLSFFAGGWSPVYPCHVDGKVMRQKPIGTGPFMVETFEPGKMIRLVRNPNYFKPGKPYLDGVEMPIIKSPSTRHLAFMAGDTDMYTPSAPLLAEIKEKMPKAQCVVGFSYAYTQLLINRKKPPFDDIRVRKAMTLAIDRDAVVKTKGAGLDMVGAELMPPPIGAWGLSKEELSAIPGHGADMEKRREEARKLMREAGYGPDKPLQVQLSTRDVARYRDVSILVIDHLSKIFVKADMKLIDTAVWSNALAKQNFTLAVRSRGQAMDDPDIAFYESYLCGSRNNYDQYCDKETQAMIDKQSAMVDVEARKKLVKEIDRRIQMEVIRPTITFAARPYCWQPHVKGYVPSLNSQYSNLRLEDVWLDR